MPGLLALYAETSASNFYPEIRTPRDSLALLRLEHARLRA
jgi:hypothetical protein